MLDLDGTWQKWEQALFESSEKQEILEPIVKTVEPEQRVGDLNDLGIVELLGTGKSSFAGSPKNRRHNIKIGADSVNGSLIPPEEEFSLLKTLGTIDKTTGYLTELVIKGNETIPEYGGGLCQIGTTTFRGTLAAGLPVTMRRPHSYTVSYYFDEDGRPGKDATIYDPWPDFKFLNDTEHHILIQAKLWGNNVMFEIWGTDDGRKVSFEGQNTVSDIKYLKPTIFNITSPGPAKEIETEELAPGERKRTEYAHNGADTVFYQYITKPGEETEKITYSSHYVPWQEVFLVGVDPEAKEKEAQEIIEGQEEDAAAENSEETEMEENTTTETEENN